MKEKSNVLQDMIKPVIVLLVICVVVAALLGYVNSITAPIVEENARIQAEQTRKAVLPGSNSFSEVPCDAKSLDIDSIYKEDSGLGYVVVSSHKGYGGLVAVTVGIDQSGKIVGLSADVSTETSGVGTKAGEEKYLSNYQGISGDASGIDTISGATYSSTAVKNGVIAALKAYAQVK